MPNVGTWHIYARLYITRDLGRYDAYDGAGSRVAQVTTDGSGVATATLYAAGGLADYTITAGVTTHTNHYSVGGKLFATRDTHSDSTTVLHYLLSDPLGTPEVQLNASGAVELVTLRSPYGTTRYGAGALAGSGFTGQREDTATGLDYYNARYYDASVGQFASADTDDRGSLNRYAYVAGNPETRIDPTGHMLALFGEGGGGDGDVAYTGDNGGCDAGACHGGLPPAPQAPPTPPQNGHNGNPGGDDGNHGGSPSPQGCGGCAAKKGDNPPSTKNADGKCSDRESCDEARSKAANSLRQKGDADDAKAVAFIIGGNLAAFLFAVAAKDISEAVEHFIVAFGWIDERLSPLVYSIFGRGSWEAKAVDTAVAALNGLVAGVHALYGVAFLAGALLTLLSAATGPGALIIQVVSIIAGGVALLAVGYGYWLLNQAKDEHDQADDIAYGTTSEWCAKTPSACADDWNKS